MNIKDFAFDNMKAQFDRDIYDNIDDVKDAYDTDYFNPDREYDENTQRMLENYL